MSLTSDDLADIKQLMTSLLSAQEKRIEAHMKEMMDKRFEEQDEKLNEILNAVGTRFNDQDEISLDNTKQIKNHEKRILRLEKQAA